MPTLLLILLNVVCSPLSVRNGAIEITAIIITILFFLPMDILWLRCPLSRYVIVLSVETWVTVNSSTA